MFQEQLAERTAEHLRTHIEAYAEEIQAQFTGSKKAVIKVPDIDHITVVGGVIQADIKSMPIIAVDCADKNSMPATESLYLWSYDGAITGIVAATDEQTVDRLVKRYASICEKFIRQHQYLHEEFENPQDSHFTIREFFFVNSNFSGAEEVELEDEKAWVDGFTCNVQWITSEDGEYQHV